MTYFIIAIWVIDTLGIIALGIAIRRLYRSASAQLEGDCPERAKDWEFMNGRG